MAPGSIARKHSVIVIYEFQTIPGYYFILISQCQSVSERFSSQLPKLPPSKRREAVSNKWGIEKPVLCIFRKMLDYAEYS